MDATTLVSIAYGVASAALGLLLVACVLCFFYLAALALHGIKVKRFAAGKRRTKFFIVIAVHNEELTLEALLDTLEAAAYPAELLVPLFVADHCSDDTVSILRRRGMKVIDRQTGPRGKSHSIAEGVARVMPDMQDEGDLLIIFDADNRLDADFFTKMSDAAASGAPILQGNTGIANGDANLFLRVNHLNYCVTNRLKELARSQSRRSCRLRGHGMAFRKSAVGSLSWQATTMVEDQELMIEMVLNGSKAVWVHDAKVFSVLPASMSEARVQRQRWAGGKSEITGSVLSRLFAKYRRDHDRISFDMMVDYLMPSYAVQLAVVALGVVIGALTLGVRSPLTLGMSTIGVLYFLYFLLGCMLERVPLRSFGAFLVSPMFIIWRAWLYLTSLRGARRW